MGLLENLTLIENERSTLLNFANRTTGQSDTRLGDAVRRLSSGYTSENGADGGGTLSEIYDSYTVTMTSEDETNIDRSGKLTARLLQGKNTSGKCIMAYLVNSDDEFEFFDFCCWDLYVSNGSRMYDSTNRWVRCRSGRNERADVEGNEYTAIVKEGMTYKVIIFTTTDRKQPY